MQPNPGQRGSVTDCDDVMRLSQEICDFIIDRSQAHFFSSATSCHDVGSTRSLPRTSGFIPSLKLQYHTQLSIRMETLCASKGTPQRSTTSNTSRSMEGGHPTSPSISRVSVGSVIRKHSHISTAGRRHRKPAHHRRVPPAGVPVCPMFQVASCGRHRRGRRRPG